MEENLLSSENIRYNEIKNTIKIWPYLDDISQAIFPYTNRHLSKDHNMVVSVDFSNVKRINSSVSSAGGTLLFDYREREFSIMNVACLRHAM